MATVAIVGLGLVGATLYRRWRDRRLLPVDTSLEELAKIAFTIEIQGMINDEIKVCDDTKVDEIVWPVDHLSSREYIDYRASQFIPFLPSEKIVRQTSDNAHDAWHNIVGTFRKQGWLVHDRTDGSIVIRRQVAPFQIEMSY